MLAHLLRDHSFLRKQKIVVCYHFSDIKRNFEEFMAIEDVSGDVIPPKETDDNVSIYSRGPSRKNTGKGEKTLYPMNIPKKITVRYTTSLNITSVSKSSLGSSWMNATKNMKSLLRKDSTTENKKGTSDIKRRMQRGSTCNSFN